MSCGFWASEEFYPVGLHFRPWTMKVATSLLPLLLYQEGTATLGWHFRLPLCGQRPCTKLFPVPGRMIIRLFYSTDYYVRFVEIQWIITTEIILGKPICFSENTNSSLSYSRVIVTTEGMTCDPILTAPLPIDMTRCKHTSVLKTGALEESR